MTDLMQIVIGTGVYDLASFMAKYPRYTVQHELLQGGWRESWWKVGECGEATGGK